MIVVLWDCEVNRLLGPTRLRSFGVSDWDFPPLGYSLIVREGYRKMFFPFIWRNRVSYCDATQADYRLSVALGR